MGRYCEEAEASSVLIRTIRTSNAGYTLTVEPRITQSILGMSMTSGLTQCRIKILQNLLHYPK